MGDEITDKIEELAQKPQRVAGDSGSVDMPNLKDLIAADKYLKARSTFDTAAKKGNRLRGMMTRIVPPGSVSDAGT